MPSRASLGEGYPYRYIKKRPSAKGGLLLCRHTYRFKTRLNKVYIVDVEEYQHQIFIIKFYLKNHQDSPKRFNLTTLTKDREGKNHYDNDGWRIISTCLNIMLEIRERHPKMSGGFIGANKIGESKVLTARFRLWRQVALTFFDPDNYTHYPNEAASAYFIQSNLNTHPDLLIKAEQMFNQLYAIPEGLFQDTAQSR